MAQPLPPPPSRSIVSRLLRASFHYYISFAIVLTALLVAGEAWMTRAEIGREMRLYEKVFAPPLAEALWAMDERKLEAVATGMVELPEIAAVRISDPASGRTLLVALNQPDDTAIGTNEALLAKWQILDTQAEIRHGFDVAYRHATGTTMVGRAELVTMRAQLVSRIKEQSALIIAVALFKEAVLWAIVLLVGHRLLARPLRHLITSIDAVDPDAPGHVTLPAPIGRLVAGTELAVMRDSFNALIDQVQEARQRLLAFNAALEQEVAQRTQALARANHDLEEQSRSLAASNAELEQFAYVASHDLRQPLRMISSYVSLLERNYAERLDDDARQYIGFARDGARRMERLIQDLLQLSRIGRNSPPMEPTPLAPVVRASLETLKCDLDQTGTEVTVDAGLPVVTGDATELGRLFDNLLGNALKYRSPDHAPSIAVGWRESENGLVTVWIRDNGIGIPAEYRDRVFQIFQRLHSAEQIEGTGIGLAVCKKIVERHGGRIWIEDSPGVGTTFLFTLRRARGDGLDTKAMQGAAPLAEHAVG